MNFKMSYIGLIALIGAVLAIASVFLNWIVVDAGFLGNGSATGWDITDWNNFDQSLYPMIVLILGIVAIVLAMLEFLGTGSQITRIIMLLLGVLVIVLGFLTYNGCVDYFGLFGEILDMGYGLYFEFAAGVALIIAPILGLAGVLDE